MPAKQQLTLEQAMTELEAMAQEMETPGLSIDKMMEYYEKLNGYRARIAKIQEGKEIEIEA